MGLPTKEDINIKPEKTTKVTKVTNEKVKKVEPVDVDEKVDMPQPLRLKKLQEEYQEAQLIAKHLKAVKIKDVSLLSKYQKQGCDPVLYAYDPETGIASVLPREIKEKRAEARIALGK